MIPCAIIIILGYGLAAIWVHVLHGRYTKLESSGARRNEIHYMLVTCNHAGQMEWYLRAIAWYASVRGQNHRITVLDDGSHDDTMAIMERMRRANGMELIVIILSEEHGEDELQRLTFALEQEKALYIDLRLPMEATKIPYVHV